MCWEVSHLYEQSLRLCMEWMIQKVNRALTELQYGVEELSERRGKKNELGEEQCLKVEVRDMKS